MTIGVGTSFNESVATATGGVPTSTSGSITTTASGSSFLIYVRAYAAPTACTDNKSNTYSLVGSAVQNTSDTDWLAVYLCTNGTGGATHKPTITFSGSLGPFTVGLIEVTGAVTSSLIDTNNGFFDQASPFGQAVTTTNANDMVVGFFGSNGTTATVTYTQGGSFTLLSAATYTTGTDGLSCGVSTRVVSATGTYDPAFTVSAGGRGPAITVALKQLATGGAVIRPTRDMNGGMQNFSGGMSS